MLSTFAQKALALLGKGEFVKTLELYDSDKVGKTLSTRALLQCVQPKVGDPADTAKLVALYTKYNEVESVEKPDVQEQKQAKKEVKLTGKTVKRHFNHGF